MEKNLKMRNIEKYNKYYGKEYDSRKIIYCVIIFILIITFFFGPIGGGDTNIDINSNTNPVNAQENLTPVIQSQKDNSNDIIF